MSNEPDGEQRPASVPEPESGDLRGSESSSAGDSPGGGVPPAGVASVADVAAQVDAGVERILRAFDEKLRYDASKQEAVDRLYSELQAYRAGLVFQAARPFIFGMIRHHAEIGKLLAGVRGEPAAEMSPAKVCKLLQSLQDDVEHVLGENGVAAYRAAVSESFDPVRQTVVGKALPTEDETRSGTIAACVSPGFERDGRILVKARVSAYRYEPASSDSCSV